MVWGAVAGSAIGLPYYGKNPADMAEQGEIDISKKPTASFGKHPPGSWSALVEPFFVAASVLGKQSHLLTRQPTSSPFTHTEVASYVTQLAEDLRGWVTEGVRAWQDSSTPYDTDFQTLTVSKQANFVGSPLTTAADTPQLPNDCAALARAMVGALMPTVERAEQMCVLTTKVTHRSQSTAAAGLFAALLIQGGLYRVPIAKDTVAYPAKRLKAYVQGAARERIFAALCDKELLYVGGRDYIGRHLGSLRCVMWTFRAILDSRTGVRGDARAQTDVWGRTLTDICRQGGSADINCALAGALLGSQFGMAVVPSWYAELPHASWVAARLEEIVGLVA